MSDGMRRELAYLSSHATNRYFIPNWGILMFKRTPSRFIASDHPQKAKRARPQLDALSDI